MPQKPPPPLAQSFLVCREVYQDRQNGEYLCLGPFTGLTLPAFPVSYRLSMFIQLVSCHGSYRIGVQLRDQNEISLLHCEGPEPIVQEDPLSYTQICWRDLIVQFPQPGRYELVLLANGDDIARHALSVGFKANM